jgi:hypothetical protein
VASALADEYRSSRFFDIARSVIVSRSGGMDELIVRGGAG